MDGTRAYRIQEKARVKLVDLYSQAKIFHLTSQQIDLKFRKIKSELPSKTPYRVIAYLDGYQDALNQELYNHYLDFRYIVNGMQVSTYKKSPIYYKKMGVTVSELRNKPCGHYWKDSDKPYYNDEVKKAYEEEKNV